MTDKPITTKQKDIETIRHVLNQVEECVGGKFNDMVNDALNALKRLEVVCPTNQ